MIYLIGYILTIFMANWALQTFGIVPIGFGLHAPAGVFFVGLSFGLRDLAQSRLGVVPIFVAILAGSLLSYAVAPSFAAASGITFLVAELADLAVFTPLRRRNWYAACVASNTVGAAIDSAMFLAVAFGSLQFFTGQFVGKLAMTAPVLVWRWVQEQRQERAQMQVAA